MCNAASLQVIVLHRVPPPSSDGETHRFCACKLNRETQASLRDRRRSLRDNVASLVENSGSLEADTRNGAQYQRGTTSNKTGTDIWLRLPMLGQSNYKISKVTINAHVQERGLESYLKAARAEPASAEATAAHIKRLDQAIWLLTSTLSPDIVLRMGSQCSNLIHMTSCKQWMTTL